MADVQKNRKARPNNCCFFSDFSPEKRKKSVANQLFTTDVLYSIEKTLQAPAVQTDCHTILVLYSIEQTLTPKSCLLATEN